MKFAWITLGILPAFAPAAPIARQNPPQTWQRLERVGQDDARSDARFDVHEWSRKLGTDDLDERERAYQDVVDLAVHDDAARAALETWAKDTSNPGLAWTARLALREVERRPGTHLRALKSFGGGAMDDMRNRFQELERRFGGLDSLFGDLQRDFDRMFQGAPPGATRHSRAESYRMRVTPEGVEIEIDEDVDGQRKTRSYKGGSIEEILQANPELRERIGDGPNVRFFGLQDPFELHVRPRQGWNATPPVPEPDADRWSQPAKPLGKPDAVRTDILGVQYTTPTDELRTKLGLDEGVGIEVERTEPRTIASALGLQPGDVVIALNGRTLKGRDDVVSALRDRQPGEPVRLEVVDPQGKRHTLTWTER
jgi:hypothetical protein